MSTATIPAARQVRELFPAQIGDVSGNGASVAKTMAATRASVLATIQETSVPSDGLAGANHAAFNHGEALLLPLGDAATIVLRLPPP